MSLVFILYISYQRLFAFRGPTHSGYYGGMILDESPEDFHGFLFVHCPTRSGYYGGMILAKSSKDFHGFFLYIVYGRLCGFLVVYLSTSACSLFQVRHPLAIMAG